MNFFLSKVQNELLGLSKIVWIVMDNELFIAKPIKIYNKHKFKSII